MSDTGAIPGDSHIHFSCTGGSYQGKGNNEILFFYLTEVGSSEKLVEVRVANLDPYTGLTAKFFSSLDEAVSPNVFTLIVLAS